MSRPTVFLRPSWDETHTELKVLVSLPSPLERWRFVELCQTMQAWTQNRVRIVFSADGGSTWFSEWGETIASTPGVDVDIWEEPDEETPPDDDELLDENDDVLE